jgi:hypothetical protein
VPLKLERKCHRFSYHDLIEHLASVVGV